MYDTILLPTDGSDHAMAAGRHALALSRAFDATVHVLGVADFDRAAGVFNAGGVDEAFKQRVRDDAGSAADRTATLAASDDAVETTVVDGDPGEAILAHAGDIGADALVMGTHGRSGLRRFVAGSVTEHVVRLSEVPVFTVRGSGEPPADGDADLPDYERVLLPTDGSDTADRAVDHALGIAEAFDGELHALNVVDVSAVATGSDIVPSGQMLEALSERGESVTSAVAERARERGLDAVTEVREDFPGSGILGYAREHEVDLVVMGTHGRTGLGRVLLGSTTERLVRKAEMPVCAVPPADRGAHEATDDEVAEAVESSEDAAE
jgi:nucleotide-binding universal stress UspA family protein